MKAKYKEDPRAWRKSTLLSILALAVLTSLLCWRHVLPAGIWRILLLVLAGLGVAAWLQPAWFRAYYRFSTWAGFWSSQAVARVILALIFGLVIAPAGVFLRILGKDPLALKRSRNVGSYWKPAKQDNSLDRLF